MMFDFLNGLDRDIQQTLLHQIRDFWTHTSTALEGNTLTLGDTKFVLDEGLTVSGKPIKDHQEVIGHAKAIELIYGILEQQITEAHLFELHKAVQSEEVSDIYKPYGAWKVEPNGTYMVNEQGGQVFLEYALPAAVPVLMTEVIQYINDTSSRVISLAEAPSVYAKIHMGVAHIHPFWDGNGRIARLIANIPLLSSGLPPIVIQSENRREYIDVIASYQKTIGALTVGSSVWPDESKMSGFVCFCERAYSYTQSLIERAQHQQGERKGKE